MGDTASAVAAATEREERKVVTVLFADLVGSTRLGELLDPEEVKLVVGDAVARIVVEIERLGGHVKDLAGDGVLAFFGAPLSYEDDAERAVRAGLQLRDEIRQYGAEVEAAWSISGFDARVGICTGSVVVGQVGGGNRVEYAAFGDTVNTAARLQSTAEPGTVAVESATQRSLEPLFEWGKRRELELQGKAAPVTAVVALRERSDGGRGRRLDSGTPLLGRDRELAAAQELVDGAAAGLGAVLFVTGEPGIGKSRFLLELRSRFEQVVTPAARWLEGRCVSYGEPLPYWPFRDLLREWLGATRADPELRVRIALRRRLEELAGPDAPALYPYVGALLGLNLEADAAARLEPLAPEALQYRTFEVVAQLLERLADARPVAVVIEDLHWGDATSIQLVEKLVALAGRAAIVLVVAQRNERDHPSWRLREAALRDFPHLTRELRLDPLPGDAEHALLRSLVGDSELPPSLERRLLEQADGNPFYLEELVRSLVDAGALVERNERLQFDHDVPFEIPPTIEKVLLARIDRLPPRSHAVLTAASALGRRFSLPLLEGTLGGDNAGGDVREALTQLQRLDLVHEARRWPQPEYRFKHQLTQEAAYRTMLESTRRALHRRAAEWLEREHLAGGNAPLGLLAHHWRAAEDEERATWYLARAGDQAREEYALDEAIDHYRNLLPLLERAGRERDVAIVLFKLALALHTALRFGEANETYAKAFRHWQPPAAPARAATETLRMAASYVPQNADPATAGWWPDIQLCMQLFDRLVEAWPERTIVPSLAESWEISDDGLRYVFRLRDGLRWSDGRPLTAHDVEFGVRRVLDPAAPGASSSVYFVLEGAQDYALGHTDDPSGVGVRALDDRTVEFRLAAPAPYFMSVVNRPDGGPQPAHAITRDGAAWCEPGQQVGSGPFRVVERTPERLMLERDPAYVGSRTGNVARVEYVRSSADEALPLLDAGDLDLVRVMYTPRTADHVHSAREAAGPLTWLAYIGFNHRHPLLSNVDLRRALALSIDRDALANVAPANLVIATGGVVPPALHGHTPEIAPQFDFDRARQHLERAALPAGGVLAITAQEVWREMLEPIADAWRRLGLEIRLDLWSPRAFDSTSSHFDSRSSLLEQAPIGVLGWLPGYPDPEYMLRLLLHSDALTNAGRYTSRAFDELIERARRATSDRERLQLFHAADRHAVADDMALVPLVYGRSTAFVRSGVDGWWEFAKSSASYADLVAHARPHPDTTLTKR